MPASSPADPLALVAFTNEEGSRFPPYAMGSLVYVGGLALDDAYAIRGIDGATVGEELRRIGYVGAAKPGWLTPHAYLELHIEQGPILEDEGLVIGAVRGHYRAGMDGSFNHGQVSACRHDADAHAAGRRLRRQRDRTVRAPARARHGRRSARHGRAHRDLPQSRERGRGARRSSPSTCATPTKQGCRRPSSDLPTLSIAWPRRSRSQSRHAVSHGSSQSRFPSRWCRWSKPRHGSSVSPAAGSRPAPATMRK